MTDPSIGLHGVSLKTMAGTAPLLAALRAAIA
jgi:hypothetical protein